MEAFLDKIIEKDITYILAIIVLLGMVVALTYLRNKKSEDKQNDITIQSMSNALTVIATTMSESNKELVRELGNKLGAIAESQEKAMAKISDTMTESNARCQTFFASVAGNLQKLEEKIDTVTITTNEQIDSITLGIKQMGKDYENIPKAIADIKEGLSLAVQQLEHIREEQNDAHNDQNATLTRIALFVEQLSPVVIELNKLIAEITKEGKP